MGSQMAINTVIEQVMVGGGHLFIQGVGQVVEQIVQTNINLLFTCDQSAQSFAIFIHNKFYYYKAIILTTFASTAFQMTAPVSNPMPVTLSRTQDPRTVKSVNGPAKTPPGMATDLPICQNHPTRWWVISFRLFKRVRLALHR